LRLAGRAFDDRLDWLVGGYFANEDLTLSDNLRFGGQYGRFANCRLITGGALAQFYDPTQVGCISPTGRAVLSGALAPAVPSPFGAAGPLIVAGLDRLDGLNNLGSTQDIYNQNSRNWALFTHNIFHVTDQFDVTVGLRYTRERKRFDATFGNNNTVCTANQASLLPFVQTPGLAPVVQAILGLSCQGNSTAELNGVSINDRRSEGELTGTGILSYRPDNDWMFYASYSRGYKAGGFNLDRSALKAPVLPFAAVGGAQALVGNLQFDPEIVDAFEIGAKFSRGPLTINAAIFRQNFSNFQLNTFNGTVFIVQNINGCSADLGGADRDQNRFPTAPNFDPNAPATGACSADDVTYGVRSQGLEVEAAFSPRRDLRFTAGFTWADTQYRSNLVGNDTGAPLDQALRVLPGNRLSNAPEFVVTGSMTWTPRLGNSGLTGLFYVDTRLTSDYNTGSDLFPQKEQDSYALVNARIGVRGPGERWALELWAQNLFDVDYAQVAFNSPFQEGAAGAPFVDPQFPGGRQIFSAFLAEPRTYGITGRFRF
jgi:iron complex outermembrane recepter protein